MREVIIIVLQFKLHIMQRYIFLFYRSIFSILRFQSFAGWSYIIVWTQVTKGNP